MRSEKEILDWLRARFAHRRARGLVVGIGDDAAVLAPRPGYEYTVTTDLFLEDVHFRHQWMGAREVGYKALACALSDLAAMGATPRFAFLSVAVPRKLKGRWIEDFFLGVGDLARKFDVALAGGDLGRTPDRVVADVVGIGEVERGRALRRSGAKPDDAVFLTGRLGLARAGLEVLLRRGAKRGWLRAAIRAHLKPSPRCSIGRYLVSKAIATAAIDISDGLSTDLNHICEESRVGARIDANKIPLPAISAALRDRLGLDLLTLALEGGEDYELLFTVPRVKADRVAKKILGVPVARIGVITRRREVVLVAPSGREVAMRPLGFDHFR